MFQIHLIFDFLWSIPFKSIVFLMSWHLTFWWTTFFWATFSQSQILQPSAAHKTGYAATPQLHQLHHQQNNVLKNQVNLKIQIKWLFIKSFENKKTCEKKPSTSKIPFSSSLGLLPISSTGSLSWPSDHPSNRLKHPRNILVFLVYSWVYYKCVSYTCL
jgi:hypothetical protein